MEYSEKEKQVIKTIEKIRPYIQADGGDVSFIKLEDDIVYVSVMGACIGCMALEQTLKEGIGALIMDEVEGIKDVRLYVPDLDF
ncbi:MAG: NifU family protein [Erysipelotrichaceae bacterium]|nr:NifU family protein [Erysipelotrichaceae bacterium]